MDVDSVARISKCTLFRGVPGKELERLLADIRVRIHSYEEGALVRSRGDDCSELLIMLAGQVAGEFQDYSGRVLRVETISAPETIASAFLFAPEPIIPVNIIALNRVRICAISRDAVVTLAQQSHAVMRSLLEDMASRAAFLAEKMRLMQFATLRQKIAGYLLEKADRVSGERVVLRATQKTIAELFGVARPSLGRVLHELEQAGVIEREQRTIRICNRSVLTRMLEESE